MLAIGSVLLASWPAHAQTGEYAAPGFPMLQQRHARPVPLPPKLASPMLPRFWHETDAVKKAAGKSLFFEFVMQQAHFPDGARPPKDQPLALMPTGRLLVSVRLRPDGSVRQPPRITKRELARPEADYPPAAIKALDAEAQRVLGALRFVRSKSLLDSLLVPMRFIAE
jgi:hypothetical protein